MDIIELTPEEKRRIGEHAKEVYYQAIEYGALDITDVISLEKDGKLMCSYRRQIENPELVPKEYVTLSEGSTAYERILSLGITPQDALEFVAKELGKPPGWVDEVKNNNYRYAEKVVMLHDTHPTQIAMLKEGTMDKTVLKASKTANHQLHRLHHQVKLHTTIKGLKDRDTELQQSITDLSAKSLIVEEDIGSVVSQLGIHIKTLDEKAYMLKEAGYTRKVIAKALGVSEATAKRAYLKHKKLVEAAVDPGMTQK